MLPSSGYKTIDRYVKLAHVPDYVLARVLEISALDSNVHRHANRKKSE